MVLGAGAHHLLGLLASDSSCWILSQQLRLHYWPVEQLSSTSLDWEQHAEGALQMRLGHTGSTARIIQVGSIS